MNNIIVEFSQEELDRPIGDERRTKKKTNVWNPKQLIFNRSLPVHALQSTPSLQQPFRRQRSLVYATPLTHPVTKEIRAPFVHHSNRMLSYSYFYAAAKRIEMNLDEEGDKIKRRKIKYLPTKTNHLGFKFACCRGIVFENRL